MTDKEVLYVSTIAKYGNITKAASELFIAQPSLTQALQRIEKEYDTPFFYRLKDGLELTEQGKMYIEVAQKISKLYKEMEFEIGDITGMQQGRINLGVTVFQGGVILPDLIIRFHQQYPRVHLNIYEASSAQLEELTSDGKLDLALLHRPFKSYELNCFSLYKEDFYLAVAPTNPDYMRLATKETPIPIITKDVLQNQRFVMQTADQRVRQISDNICMYAQITPEILFTTASCETALALASKGFGAAFISKSLANYYGRHKLAFFKFPHQWHPRWELVAAFSKNVILPRPCFELVKVLQECIADMPEVFI